jgi:hypothetical protein
VGGDHLDSEMLVPDEHLSKSIAVPARSLMVIFDYPCIPAFVLVVEDEMMLRMCAVDMVVGAGYKQLEAPMPPKPSPSWNPDPTSR